MNGLRHPASFRDTSGFVFRRQGVLHRQVQHSFAPHYDKLLSSGLYADLTRDGLLVEHEEVDAGLALAGAAYRVLRPVQLPFISYPYEWCFSQLRDAALLTLEVQRRALIHEMSLKDASAYNVQWHNGQPVFIDTLSLEAYEEGRPWSAYRQFCQHFLAPLALMSRADVRLAHLLQVHLDGVPLDLASRLLPWTSRLSLSLGLHIHAHARSQKKHESNSAAAARRHFSRRAFLALIDHLRRSVEGLAWKAGQTEWSDYYEANNNYDPLAMQSKQQVVARFLDCASPRTVWDLGANDGRFGRLALEHGAELVVAWDIDPACVEANYRHTRQQGERGMLPLVLDLTNPTPAIGWAHGERMSLAERGPADALLALGLIHHLAISNNVPLGHIARYLRQLGKWLIIEWVPKQDSQVQRLLASRQDIFAGYQQAEFEQAFAASFEIVQSVPVMGSQRVLYLMRVRA